MRAKHPNPSIAGLRRLLLYAGILLLTALSLSPSAARAAQAGVRLEILPSTLQLQPNQPVEILLVLHNPTAAALEELELTWWTGLDLTLEPAPSPAALPPGGQLSLRATLTRPEGSSPAAGTVYFQLSYLQAEGSGDAAVPGTATATLEIQEPALEKVEEMAEVRIETALDLLEEQRSGQIFLVVHNLANRPIRIVQVTARKPTFVILGDVDPQEQPPRLTEQPLLTDSAEVLPQESQVITIPVSLAGELQPGQHRILFDIDLQWEKNRETFSGSLVAAHTIQAGILGESDLLKLVGVPSILFLPGFLMLTMFVMLSGRLPPRIRFDLSPAEFALFSISLSLVTALAYPRITGLYGGESRNYLQAYGLTDIFLVWFGSVAAGFVGWAVFFGLSAVWSQGTDLWKAYRARQAQAARRDELARRTPRAGDNPLQVLEKMAMQEIRLPLEDAVIELQGHSLRGFLLLPDPGDASAIWVSPPVLLRPREPAGLADDPYRQVRRQHLEQIEAAQTAAELAAALGRAADTWEIVWNGRGVLTGPRRVLQAELKDRRRSVLPFVELE